MNMTATQTFRTSEYKKALKKCNNEQALIFLDTFHLKYVVKNRSFDDAMNSAKSAVFDSIK